MSARDDESGVPAGRAPPCRRLNRVDVDPATRDHPGDHRVRVPHLARPELITTPHGSRDLWDQVEHAPSALLLFAEPPRAIDGFGDIRYLFENEITPAQYMAGIWVLLAVTLAAFAAFDRSRYGRALRQAGTDPLLAELQGIRVVRVRLVAAAAAGALAGLGGGLYAHLLTYVEPGNFNIMLGVHSLAYGLIGGLGTAFGPVLGVLIDIGLLESSRLFAGYRMIVFGGLVALLLIVRPRGLLDERLVHRIRRLVSRRPPPAPTNAAVLGEEPS